MFLLALVDESDPFSYFAILLGYWSARTSGVP